MASTTTEVRPKWQDVALKVRNHRDETLSKIEPRVPDISVAELPRRVISLPRKYLTSEEITITESSTTDLLAALAKGELTSLKVTKAFLRRAVAAQKLVNCVYELLPERALARAKELDEYFAQNGPIGPLHGLPISVKAMIGVKGLVNSVGLVGWSDMRSPDDANILKILLEAGAVLYVRTNEPQGVMMIETANNIIGVTTNPHNRDLTPGGSSGGEGALIALGGSLLGIGSDIGGSIRNPAANCGIYGFNPTSFRLPLIGLNALSLGCDTVAPAVGPMCSDLEGIELFMKTIIDSKPWTTDLSLHQMPWRKSDTPITKLTIGVMWDDNIVKPSPPVTRALKEAVEKLKLVEGVEIVEWKPYKHDMALDILTKLYSPDGGHSFKVNLEASGEPWMPLIAHTMRDKPGVQNLSHQELWDWSMQRNIFQYMYLNEWNNFSTQIDVILCPAGPIPAPAHGTSKYWGYLSVWNLLDYPSIVFPVSRVDVDVDGKEENYVPRNEEDKWSYDTYDVREQVGAPVGLQLVGKKMEDEKVLNAMRFIKEKIGVPFVDCFGG